MLKASTTPWSSTPSPSTKRLPSPSASFAATIGAAKPRSIWAPCALKSGISRPSSVGKSPSGKGGCPAAGGVPRKRRLGTKSRNSSGRRTSIEVLQNHHGNGLVDVALYVPARRVRIVRKECMNTSNALLRILYVPLVFDLIFFRNRQHPRKGYRFVRTGRRGMYRAHTN